MFAIKSKPSDKTGAVLKHHRSNGRANLGILLWMLVVVSLSACWRAKNDPDADRSFITDHPCAAPCWYGLEPDKSSQAEVLATLQSLPFVDKTTIRESRANWGGDENAKTFHFDCIHPKEKNCGGAIISGGKLGELWLTVGYPLSLKMAVDKLGVPDYVEYGLYHPDVGGSVVFLDWPERGIGVEVFNEKDDRLYRKIREGQGIPPEVQVTGLYYFEAGDFGSEPPNALQRIEWPGFSE